MDSWDGSSQIPQLVGEIFHISFIPIKSVIFSDICDNDVRSAHLQQPPLNS